MTKARTLADNYAADISGITAGTGITGGGTSGTVTITNDMATTIAAKGDLIVGTGNDTYNRLAVASTAGYLLSVDSAETTGLKWTPAPSSGGMTLLSTTTLSAVSTTISNISQDYVDLVIRAVGLDTASNANLRIRVNEDSGSNYRTMGYQQWSDTAVQFFGSPNTTSTFITSADSRIGNNSLSDFELTFLRYTQTARILYRGMNFTRDTEGSYWMAIYGGRYDASAAITSFTLTNSNSESMTGTVYIYGVK